MSDLFKIDVQTIDGKSQSMNDYAGKVLLVVNVASKCGFTPQYEGLESVYKQLKDRGLVVMGFPCNQFGAQEPGSEAEIATFCETRFNVSFPMFAKVKVNGEDAHPLYKHLKGEKPGVLGTEGIKWNFTKFSSTAVATSSSVTARPTSPRRSLPISKHCSERLIGGTAPKTGGPPPVFLAAGLPLTPTGSVEPVRPPWTTAAVSIMPPTTSR